MMHVYPLLAHDCVVLGVVLPGLPASDLCMHSADRGARAVEEE